MVTPEVIAVAAGSPAATRSPAGSCPPAGRLTDTWAGPSDPDQPPDAEISDPGGGRPGRPRNPACDRAIARAAIDLLVEDGFAGVTMEGVANRAGVGKATVYRRWDDRAQLLVDALGHRFGDEFAEPHNGDVRADLVEMLHMLLARFRAEGDVMRAFLAEAGRHPQLGEAFRTTFLARRRHAMLAIVQRGVDQGQLPSDTDVELVADAGPALLWHRFAVTGVALDDALPERIVRQLLPSAV